MLLLVHYPFVVSCAQDVDAKDEPQNPPHPPLPSPSSGSPTGGEPQDDGEEATGGAGVFPGPADSALPDPALHTTNGGEPMDDGEAVGGNVVEGCSGGPALPSAAAASVSGGEPMDVDESPGGTGAAPPVPELAQAGSPRHVRRPLAELALTAVEILEQREEVVRKRNQKRKRECKQVTWAGEPWLPCFSTDFHTET
jgi:hypothetical protein